MIKRCPNCNSTSGHCPECGRIYAHGATNKCIRYACQLVNAPIDCECGFVVSDDLQGVLNFDMKLLPWKYNARWRHSA